MELYRTTGIIRESKHKCSEYTTTMIISHVQFELILKQVKWKPSAIIRNQVLWEKRMESLLKERLAKEEQKNPGCLLEGLTHRRKDGYVS